MNVLSLFDGISAGQLALKRAGIGITKYYASEIDKYAIPITKRNFPDTIHLGDVEGWGDWDLPQIDLLVGGSPCQNLSIAGDRTGLEGSQSSLFWKYVECLKHFKPKWFLFENVASMKKSDKSIITEALGVDPILINSALVSAQKRNRLYWTNIKNVTLPQDKGILLKDILESGNKGGIKTDKVPTLTSGASYEHNNLVVISPIRLGEIGSKAQGNRVYSVKGKSVSLSANGGGWGANTGLYKIDLPDGDYIIRKLTPIEAERCQTFPDDYTAFGVNQNGKEVKISNSQRYKCVGNSWTVDVIAHILKGLTMNG